MEFQFRAGDERSGPPPPSTDAAATSADSKSAGARERVYSRLAPADLPDFFSPRCEATHVQDSHGTHSTGENAEPVPPPASDPDELLRQAAKARIRERILREEPEIMAELEAEVRRELLEERIQLLRSGLGRSAGACALGSVIIPPPSGTQTRIDLEAQSKANVSVALPLKRKNPDVAVASTASISTSSNKQKLDLSCTVCGIALTSEKTLQDHLKGKVHMRKAARVALPKAEAGHEDVDEATQVHRKAKALAVLPDKQKTPNIVTATNSKTQQPDLTCKVCGITLTSQKTMQDHLEGRTHKRKFARLPQPMPEEVITNMAPSKENVPTEASIVSAASSGKKHKLDLMCTVCCIAVTSEKGMEDHLKGKTHRKKGAALVPEEEEQGQEEKEEEGSYTPNKINLATNDGAIYEVIQMNGSVFCEVCKVSTLDKLTMICHLQGTKHISKARQKAATTQTTATTAATIADGDPQTVAMMINGVPHTVRRVGGSLLCELCDVKVPLASEGVMRAHLSGKTHTKKLKAVAPAVDMGAAAGKAEMVTKDVALATNVHSTERPVQEVMKDDDGADTIGGSVLVEAKSKETSLVGGTVYHTQGNDCMEKPAVGACAPESVAPDERVTVRCPTATVVEKKADTEGNSSQMQETEAVKTDGIAVVPADEEVKYQVEGKEFIVLRQLDGRLSCRLCAVHGYEKHGMIKHLYTHLENALTEMRSRV